MKLKSFLLLFVLINLPYISLGQVKKIGLPHIKNFSRTEYKGGTKIGISNKTRMVIYILQIIMVSCNLTVPHGQSTLCQMLHLLGVLKLMLQVEFSLEVMMNLAISNLIQKGG